MKQRVAEMEREANKLRELQAAAEQATSATSVEEGDVTMHTEEDRAAADMRSIHIGNVCDFFSSYKTLLTHFHRLGGLRCNSRGNSGTFPGLWDHQSCDHPMRQVHRSF